MDFVKWPSIENTYQEKFITSALSAFPELTTATYLITEKLHGSNWQFCVSPDGVRCGSRKRFLDPAGSFQGADVTAITKKYSHVISYLQQKAIRTGHTYRLFGELIGLNVQKGVDYGEGHRILFFGLMVDDVLLPPPFLGVLVTTTGIPLVPIVTKVQGLRAALEYDTNFLSLLNPVEGNICEGVVIQPYRRVYQLPNGSTFLLKKKNEAFMEKQRMPKPPSPGAPEVTRLNLVFRNYLTGARLDGVFSKRGRIEEIQQMGQYIRYMLEDAKEDFLKDHEEAFAALSKGEQRKTLNVGSTIANMLKDALKGDIGR